MKNILVILMGGIFIGRAFGAMCMSDVSLLIVLDKDKVGDVVYGAPVIDGMKWRIDVDYDTFVTPHGIQRFIRGSSGCIDYAGDGTKYYVDSSAAANAGVTGGRSCWCIMLRPATTYPIYTQTYNSVTDCKANCAQNCADSIKNSYEFRDKFFEAVW